MPNELISVEDLSKLILEDCKTKDKELGLKLGTSAKLASLQISASNGFPVTKEEVISAFMEGYIEGKLANKP